LRQDFEKAAPRVVAAYGERNLNAPNIKSGAFARAMKEFAQNRIKQESRAQQDLAQGDQQFNLGMAQLGSGYKSSLADLEADKAREIEQTAADLMRLRSGY
jgi:cell division septum initiation protein DivIVA